MELDGDLAHYYVEAIVEQNRSASHVDRFTRKPWEGDAKGIDQAKEKFRDKHDGPGVVGFDFDNARICKKVEGGWIYVEE